MIYSTHTYPSDLFDAFFGTESKNVGYFPMKTNVYESDAAYRLDVELPGVEKDDIAIDFKDGYLTIAVKTEKKTDEEFKLVRRERFSGETSRQFYLGEVDEKAITANYESGVLSIRVPKAKPEEVKPFRIAIQ